MISVYRVFVTIVQILGWIAVVNGTRRLPFARSDILSFTQTAARRHSSIPTAALKVPRSECSEPLAVGSTILSIRGGQMELSEGDQGGLVLKKLRNVLRSVLTLGDKKAPVITTWFRGCLKSMETLTGVRLLPHSKVTKEAKNSKNKKNKRKEKQRGKDYDTSSRKFEEEEKKASSSQTKKGNDSVTADPSQATKKHLASNIKSTNPNYRIQRELKEFIKSPPPNISVQVGSNLRVWIVTMIGAKNTIYEGEVFKLRVSFPPQYPTVPPSVYFLQGYMPTHEHVYTNGDICLSLLGADWRPTMTAQSIVVSILSILSSAQSKSLPMGNAQHAGRKPGEYQKDWIYHDDNC